MMEESLLRNIAAPLYRVKGWMKFAGVLSIIQGVFSVLTIWGILICWIPIWMGVLLCAASNHVRTAFETDNDDELRMSMQKLATYFQVFGILSLISIIVAVIGILAAISIPAFVAARQAALGQ